MLAYILAIAVGLGSFCLYMAAFFYPEVHRKHDFTWSGVGLFYALVLWVCAGRITGGVLLGQIASVVLLGWFGWQTLTLRRELTPHNLQTRLPGTATSLAEILLDRCRQIQATVQTRLKTVPVPAEFTNLSGQATKTISGLKDFAQGVRDTTLKPKSQPPVDLSSTVVPVPPTSQSLTPSDPALEPGIVVEKEALPPPTIEPEKPLVLEEISPLEGRVKSSGRAGDVPDEDDLGLASEPSMQRPERQKSPVLEPAVGVTRQPTHVWTTIWAQIQQRLGLRSKPKRQPIVRDRVIRDRVIRDRTFSTDTPPLDEDLDEGWNDDVTTEDIVESLLENPELIEVEVVETIVEVFLDENGHPLETESSVTDVVEPDDVAELENQLDDPQSSSPLPLVDDLPDVAFFEEVAVEDDTAHEPDRETDNATLISSSPVDPQASAMPSDASEAEAEGAIAPPESPEQTS